MGYFKFCSPDTLRHGSFPGVNDFKMTTNEGSMLSVAYNHYLNINDQFEIQLSVPAPGLDWAGWILTQ